MVKRVYLFTVGIFLFSRQTNGHSKISLPKGNNGMNAGLSVHDSMVIIPEVYFGGPRILAKRQVVITTAPTTTIAPVITTTAAPTSVSSIISTTTTSIAATVTSATTTANSVIARTNLGTSTSSASASPTDGAGNVNNNLNDGSNNGLPKAAIIAIAAAGGALAVIGFGIFCFRRRVKPSNEFKGRLGHRSGQNRRSEIGGGTIISAPGSYGRDNAQSYHQDTDYLYDRSSYNAKVLPSMPTITPSGHQPNERFSNIGEGVAVPIESDSIMSQHRTNDVARQTNSGDPAVPPAAEYYAATQPNAYYDQQYAQYYMQYPPYGGYYTGQDGRTYALPQPYENAAPQI